jgi:hypothetical protein
MGKAYVVVAGICLASCAGPLLNEYTEYLGPRVGSLEERQVLQNLARFVDNPWAIPGHVELSNGTIQATNMLGVNLKYPFSQAVTTSSVSAAVTTARTVGSELDLNPAQTQDQESYTIVPVTDPDDLRRLRAIYHYAICPNPWLFEREWEIADQFSYPRTRSATAPKTPTVKPPSRVSRDRVIEIVNSHVQAVRSSPSTEHLTKTENDLAGLRGANQPPLTPQQRSQIDAALAEASAPQPTKTPEQATDTILMILESTQRSAAAAPGGGTKDQTTGTGDNIAYEQAKARIIVRELGIQPWLYIRTADGTFVSPCRNGPDQTPVDPEQLISLGSYRGHALYATDLKKFSDLVLFVLGGIPNTTGTHILDGASGGAVAQPKSKAPYTISIPGVGTSPITPPKGQ